MEMLFLLKNLYRDPLALSRFSQFRYLHIGKGEIIQNLNENHEFQVCFVLKGSLCLFRDQMESMSCSHYLKFAIAKTKLPPFSVMPFRMIFSFSYPS